MTRLWDTRLWSLARGLRERWTVDGEGEGTFREPGWTDSPSSRHKPAVVSATQGPRPTSSAGLGPSPSVTPSLGPASWSLFSLGPHCLESSRGGERERPLR